MRLITNDVAADARSRLIGIRLATLTLRLRGSWTQLFGDPDAAAIALAIVAIGAERMLREPYEPEVGNLAVQLPVEAFGPCNISSIAKATGFNRETTRRKVDELARRGMVVRDGSNITLARGFTQQPAALGMVRTQLDALRMATNELIREGVIQVVE